MKKLITLLLALTMIFSLCACSSSAGSDSTGEGAAAAVRAAGFFPADTTVTGVYEGHEMEAILEEYNATMIPLAADYYQVTTGWAEARTNWWNMLQEVGASDGTIEAITEIVNARCDMANGK